MTMKKYIIYFLVGAICVAAAIFVPRYLNESRKSIQQKSVVYIPLDATYSQMCDSVATAVQHMESFSKVAHRAGLEQNFKPGRYVFTPDKSNKDLVRMLQKGWEQPMMLTLGGNIRSLEKLSGILGRKLACDSASFSQYFAKEEVWKENGFGKETFMAMFIPNTYEVYWNLTPEDFLKRMNRERQKFWNTKRQRKAADLGMTYTEVVVLASIRNVLC